MSTHDSNGTATPMAPASTPTGSAGFTGPGGPAARPHRRATSGMAIATLILGVAGFLVITIPVSLVLGVLSLVRTGRQGQKGKGLATTGMVLAVAWAVGLAVVVAKAADSPEPARDAKGQISEATQAAPEKLKVGDCVAQINDTEVSDVRAQPCSRPGSGKVFAIFQLTHRAWPGEAAANKRAGDDCVKRYERSRQQAKKQSEIQFLRPTEASWRLGDRRVVCLVVPKA
ncbi:DUF4190 domain-containing protein [Actinomadura sp. HBU206391]|uniref:DUF4190 domain-containing protein n=1 Tax=Actinomadura sp. HBU206391 TaxID=2731692 RepID=UPI00165050F8|nr:DUF4190 domain-containing protein [Actinomadura sp. HBU206391]MBC6456698.1 DUF4190 domain-containing protein [Actinomadura sp. HBU206391]